MRSFVDKRPPLISIWSNVNVRKRLIPVTNRAQKLAQRLLALEVDSRKPHAADAGVDFRVYDKLRRPLSSLTGTTGFAALASRALTLTKAEVPGLADAKIGEDGCFEHLSEIEPRLNADEAARGEAVLIGNMVDLLCTILGEALTLRLIQDVWPDASFNDRGDGKDTKA
ncbi:MAG: hypothetical protein ACRYGF_12565 [Janthinobacterium lividum]